MRKQCRKLFVGCVASLGLMPVVVDAMGKPDDPWLTKVMGEVEFLSEDGHDVVEWEIDTWLGRDLSKFWLKTEGEYARSDDESGIEEAQIELLYSQAVAPYWDRQFGIRHDIEPEVDGDTRSWLVAGFIGTAVGFWEVDANLYVGEESSVQLNIELEKELMITQKWVLTPEFDITFNGKTNEEFGEGSGLSEIEAGLRLGYEPNRKFQPFIAIEAHQTFGATRRIEKAEGHDSGELTLLAGIHFWF